MTNRYDNGRGTATYLLQHYFRLVAQESGLRWDSDMDSEVAQIADALLQAARQESIDAIVGAMREADAATQEEALPHVCYHCGASLALSADGKAYVCAVHGYDCHAVPLDATQEDTLRPVQLHTHTVKCGACLQDVETLFWRMDSNAPMATACPACGVEWESFQTVAIPAHSAPTADSLRAMFPEED